jgi:formylglycine-generating enzyme required for sulfatase activity/tRNA A-37 threonylcarbamoyl transferase component Bud32
MERDPLNIVGQTVADKYRIEKLVGEGGFAVVYRALHTIWKKPVAIKFFNGLASAPVDQREQFQEAFVQEGALLTELSSETAAIVQARDIGTLTLPDGQWMPFMVLEWLEGATLDALLESERAAGKVPWSLSEVYSLLAQVAAALDVAHGKGIAHRDIKPANLFVLTGDARGGRVGVKVLDFGVAKMMSDNTQLKAALAKTGMGVTSFTPQYAAPEQFTRSYGATGPWTDVYALALVAVEMLTLRPALEGDDIVQLGFASGNPERRPTPRMLGLAVPDAVEAVFQKALAVSPKDRFPRTADFWSAFGSALGGERYSTVAMPPSISFGSQRGAPTAPTELAPSQPGIRSSSTTDGSAAATGPGPSAPRSKAGLFALGGVVVAGGIGAAFFLKGSGESTSNAAARPVAPVASVAPPVASTPPAPLKCPDGMALIPKGQYFQGSDAKDAKENQKPAHNVMLDAYCVDLRETTAAEYEACSSIGKCKRASNEVDWPEITPADKKLYSPLCTFGQKDKADHPINCVSWEMARTYCKAQDKRLPTEAEWEYATRGPDGRIYPWGDEEPTAKHLNACGTECVAWGRKNGVVPALESLYPTDDGFPTTAPVGKYEAGKSRFGPYDVVGNVWEWVSDWYADYTPEEKKNPVGPEGGERKVIRGGAFNGSYKEWLRPSYRYAQDPNAFSYGIGIRCAKALGP